MRMLMILVAGAVACSVLGVAAKVVAKSRPSAPEIYRCLDGWPNGSARWCSMTRVG